LALNGTSEAFVHSVASEKQLEFVNVLFVVFSALFVTASVILLRIPGLAAVGLVLANAFNMTMRIIYSFYFISRWQKENKLDDKADGYVSIFSILPDKIVLAALVVTLSCGVASALYSPNMIVHIVIGCVLFGGFIFTVLKKERKLFSDIRKMWSGKSN